MGVPKSNGTTLHSSVIPFDFEPTASDTTWIRTDDNMYPAASTTEMSGHPYLPSSVTVTGARCWVRDADVGTDIEISLVRKTLDGSVVCGTATSTGATGQQPVYITTHSCTDDTNSNATAANYSVYYVKVKSSLISTTQRVYQCSIDYEEGE